MLNLLATSCPKVVNVCLETLSNSEAVVVMNETIADELTGENLISLKKRAGELYCLSETPKVNTGTQELCFISYDVFVDLCCLHNPIHTWY